jgi:hypothetical protein
MGHSTGRWEGDTLVVDTVAINERTWLDSLGLEHSSELRLTERFRPTVPDTLEYAVTYEDPVFFEEPWTLTLELNRLTDTRLIEYVCSENERDRVRLRSILAR